MNNKEAILCPFHQEKTPSCVIDHSAGTFFCFSCAKTGNLQGLKLALTGVNRQLKDRVGLRV